jgi:DNA ligase-1
MAGTPSKRRKKNDHQSSNQPVRGLDFFFGKQQAAQKEQAAGTNGVGATTSDTAIAGDTQEVEDPKRPLTDEEYALKLQAEFDEQDRLLAANNTNGQKDDDAEEKPSDVGDIENRLWRMMK